MAKPYKNAENHPELFKLGNAIKMMRKQKKLSQEKLAELAGIDRSYMGGIERGEHNIALININRIAKGLGMSIALLMENANL
jgi:transcriptional regulator with XRE-family HTH domain